MEINTTSTSSDRLVQHQILKKLMLSSDYRSFLKIYLDEKSMSLSQFARACGFGRGFPGDILSGRRRLTAKSYYAFENALKLTSVGKKIFKCLVALEEPDIFPQLQPESIAKTLAELKGKTSYPHNRRETIDDECQLVNKVLTDTRAAIVYAAAGDPSLGASLEQLKKRTQLDEIPLKDAISLLLKCGFLKYKEAESKYFPEDFHLFVKTTENNKIFINQFQKACELASERANSNFNSETDLFFTSIFCVEKKKLPELKMLLRKTILDFIDDAIEVDGDQMVRIVTGMHV